MFKYIIKRLLISILILFGVSLIIYTLVRMMPNDYIDKKFATQISTGAVKQADVDRFKKLYGLATPDAYLHVDIDGYGRFTADTKETTYQTYHGTEGTVPSAWYSWYALSFDSADGKMRLNLNYDELKSTQTFDIFEVETSETKNADGKAETTEKLTKLASGVYTIDTVLNGRDIAGISLTFSGESSPRTADISYARATGWQKFQSVVHGYLTWVNNMLHGDLGNSFKYDKPVAKVIGENMWISFAIAAIATVLQFLIAIPLGISSATHQYSVRDYTVTIFTMIGLSLPTYFFAAIVIKLFAVDLGWLPVNGLLYASKDYGTDFLGVMEKFGDIARHLVLPIAVSVLLSIGGLMRYTRTNTLEVLNADYIRTARAKGLSEHTVIYKHAFRNTMIPLATLLAGILPSLFGGMMITEQVFGIDGIGRLAYQALKDGDVPFVMGYNMFLAILTIIGTLFSDIMYSVVDPRVKLGK